MVVSQIAEFDQPEKSVNMWPGLYLHYFMLDWSISIFKQLKSLSR